MVTKPGTLVITGEIKDAEDNVVSASLSVNGKIVKENLELPSFSFTLSLDEIERGECTIALEAKDDEGLSGQSEVKIGLKDENASALLINGSSDNVEIGYDGDEQTIRKGIHPYQSRGCRLFRRQDILDFSRFQICKRHD